MSRLADLVELGYPSPMSDIPAPPKTDGVHWTHYCEAPGCTSWGSYGHEVGARTAWYCREHDPCGGRGAEGTGWRAPKPGQP